MEAEDAGNCWGFGGGGDSGDVFEFSLAEELVNVVDGVLGSGAGAEAEDHAGLDVLDGLVGGDFLEVVLGEDDGGGGGGVDTVEEGEKGFLKLALGFSKIKGDKLKKKIKIKSKKELVGIPEARILHRFYKNRCCNSFSKTDLSNLSLKF